jgi:hypothetical protein
VIDPNSPVPSAIFRSLERHCVDHVTVGGVAVCFWASPRVIKDVDIIVPEADDENERRLLCALRELGAHPLGKSIAGVDPSQASGYILAPIHRWRTRAGVLDVMRRVWGVDSYEELRSRGIRTSVFGASTTVARRDDLITMKLVAARFQDVCDLESLYGLDLAHILR